MRTFDINKMRKAARRQIEIDREIPRFKEKVHSSGKDYKRPKHKKQYFDLED